MVVQGVVDLAVIQSEEITLLDFKTDHASGAQLKTTAKLYAPQLQLYAQALSLIYRRPVSACWLYFLAAHQAVPVPLSRHSDPDLPPLKRSRAGDSSPAR